MTANLQSPPEVDLFGSVVLPEKKSTKANGYAYPPGTGPANETCSTCSHFIRRLGGRYFKCGLTRWTHGPGTDIRAKSPACKLWAK